MKIFTIEKIETFPSAELSTIVVDSPATGAHLTDFALFIQARIRGAVRHYSFARIAVDGRPLRTYPVFLDGEILRFAALVGAVEVAERFHLSITLSGAAAADRVCARISGRRAIGFRTAETGEAVPVLVVSQGRAGSTAAMCALGAHPDILIRNRFPFETRMMQYFAGLAAMQLRPADLTDPELEALDGPKGPGPNPYYRPDPETVPWMARTAARQAIQHSVASTWSFYAHCAGIQGKADFRAVAEKAPPDPRRIGLVRMLFPDLRLVLLLRDPRDVLASIMAFNEKRGYAAFGREAARDDVDFARSFVKSVEQLAEFRRLAPEATILRYEDLIRTPNESLASVFRSLGLGFGEGLVGGAVAEMLKDRDGRVAGHRTTGMAADSIGRWKSDLQPDIQEIVRNAMRPALEALDYTVA